MCVNSSITHHSQKVEATQVPINKCGHGKYEKLMSWAMTQS